jgi:hypothetical protein
MKKFVFLGLLILLSGLVLACSPAVDDTQEVLGVDYDDDLLDFEDLVDSSYDEQALSSDLGLDDFDDQIIQFGELI